MRFVPIGVWAVAGRIKARAMQAVSASMSLRLRPYVKFEGLLMLSLMGIILWR